LRDHAGRAVQLQHEADCYIRGHRSGTERIETVAGGAREQLIQKPTKPASVRRWAGGS
jgi:hypothetical protein